MFVDPGPPRADGHLEALRQDMLVPPKRTDWSRQVADERIRTTDRLRPFLTRGVLQLAMAGCLLTMTSVSWWAWALWLPGLVQTVLEIGLEDRVRARALDSSVRGPIKLVMQFWYRMYEVLPFNVTGLLGTLAVPANLVMAVYATGPDTDPVMKVGLFVLTLLYANSGILGTLMDTPWFSPLAKILPAVHRVYPLFWLIGVGVAVGLVLGGQLLGRWPDGTLPFALMACGLGYYIGLRIREYVRDLQACARVLVKASLEEKALLAIQMHDRLQFVKYGLPRVIDTADLSTGQRVALRTFVVDVNEQYDEARKGNFDVRSSLRPPFEGRVGRMLDGTGISYAGSTFELDGQLDDLNYRLAQVLLTNLLQNAKQAYEADPFYADPRVVVTMTIRGAIAAIAVRDDLAAVDPMAFARHGSTLAHLRDQVRAQDGDLVQTVHSDGKTVTAHWSTAIKPLREQDPDIAKDLP